MNTRTGRQIFAILMTTLIIGSNLVIPVIASERNDRGDSRSQNNHSNQNNHGDDDRDGRDDNDRGHDNDDRHDHDNDHDCHPTPTPTPTTTPTPTVTPTLTPTPTITPSITPTIEPTPTTISCPKDSVMINGVCMHPQPQLAPPSSDGLSDGRGGVSGSVSGVVLGTSTSIGGRVLGASTMAATGGEDVFNSYSESNTRLVINDLKIDLPVIDGGLVDNNWILSNDAVMRAQATDLVGSKNTILYGHNWERLLGSLGNIKVGQDINFDGAIYRVTKVQKVAATATDVLEPLIGDTLTVFTCTGIHDELRFVVTAVRING